MGCRLFGGRQGINWSFINRMRKTSCKTLISIGNEKHNLHVTPKEGCSEPVLQDLAQAAEEATGVPLSFQKLIFKGRCFISSFEPLFPITQGHVQNHII